VWPSIGPDVTPMAGSNPAHQRFLKMPAAERGAQNQRFLQNFIERHRET
jgi:hypothetical protein